MNEGMMIECLPKLYEIGETIEQACLYAQSDFKARKAQVLPVIQAGITAIYAKTKELFGTLSNEVEQSGENLSHNPIMGNYENWKQNYWVFTITKVSEKLRTVLQRNDICVEQYQEESIYKFLEIFQKLKVDSHTYAVIELFLSEFCRTSCPKLAYNLIIEAFSMYPDIVKLPHIKSSFEKKIINEQQQLNNCPVCSGKGFPYHTAPAYLINTFQSDFLPAKLWMKCECCGNLYTRYFPKKFFNRKNQLKVITPHQNIEQKLASDVSIRMLRTWCDMLQNMKQYTKGKNILEIGVGKGALIATAIEMGYPIDCVEIEEDVAQNIADLLQHPVICCDFLDLPEEKTYDIISMGDVIEHLDDPRKGLEKARRLLKEDGVIWISTPNYNSAFNQLNRNCTAMWDEPWHITYFSREGLEKLLSEVGFDVLDYRISNHYNGSMEMIVQKKKN